MQGIKLPQGARKAVMAAAIAATAAAGLGAATPAMAQRHYYRHHDNDAGVAIGAGILGLAVGAAIASDRPHYYREDYYDYDRPVYYGRPVYYYDAPGYYYARPYPVYRYRDGWRWHHRGYWHRR